MEYISFDEDNQDNRETPSNDNESEKEDLERCVF